MIFVQTNDADANAVVVFDHDLAPRGTYSTGGRGTGMPHLPSQGSVVVGEGRLLVANAGSGELSVFDVGRMELLGRVPTGGNRPVSVTADGGTAWVLNGGDAPSIGELSLRERSLVRTHPLGAGTDPAQLALAPEGGTLVVSERGTNAMTLVPVDGGDRVSFPSAGETPYGFDFAGGTLVVTEAFGGAVGAAAASSYQLDERTLRTVSTSVPDGRSEVCWAVASVDGRTVWVTNFGDGTVSRYAVAADGTLELADPVAGSTTLGVAGIRDAARSADGELLYALDADARRVFAWRVVEGGALEPAGSADGLPATAAGLAAL
jgi:6-phosphogluconolactonase